ncbi:MAG: Txe/YoeB family addiction module toxin [Clostridia bacterium]|nr:Txe/YoeB family addiction module toxin [Clostridia bacterium]
MIDILCNNPYQNPPPYEKLSGNLSSCYSRRINSQHRLVYTVDEKRKIVKILSMWTHYEF